MEYALWAEGVLTFPNKKAVLILILMEYALRGGGAMEQTEETSLS